MVHPPEPYCEGRHRQQVEAAVKCMRTLLDRSRAARPLGDAPPHYDNQYAVAAGLTRSLTAALVDLLGFMGVTRDALRTMVGWAKEGTVTLCLTADEKCTYRGEKTREVQCGFGVEQQSLFRKTSHKIFQTVKDHEWAVDLACVLSAFPGNNPRKALNIEEWQEHVVVHTKGKESPRPEGSTKTLEVQLTTLFEGLGSDLRPSMSIDRRSPHCHTPRRNAPVEAALELCRGWGAWSLDVMQYFTEDFLAMAQVPTHPFEALSVEETFLPVVPVLVGDTNAGAETASAPTAEDMGAFLAEHRRQVQERLERLATSFPEEAGEEGGLSISTARFLVLTVYMLLLFQGYRDAVDSVEDLLRKQLVAAVGHEVEPEELASCMQYHFWRLLRAEYRLQPFAYPIRRPGCSLQGTLAVETTDLPGMPIHTISHVYDSRTLSFPLSAATKVYCQGPHFIHAFVAHRFSNDPMPAMHLRARARQCSGFVLVVGRLQDKDGLEPVAACIVQNQEELRIPLQLEPLPTPKEFRDAIASLSPKQRDFAGAIRSLQLSSTVFGVLAIPIVPALEAVLGLPPHALAKEVQLTQDLMALFIEHQIPSDLLGARDAGQPISDPDAALQAVRQSVGSMQCMLDAARQAELARAREEAGAYYMQAPTAVASEAEADPEVLKWQTPASSSEGSEGLSGKLSALRDLMVCEIDSLITRGERLDQLVEKSCALSCEAKQFQCRATAIKSRGLLGRLCGGKASPPPATTTDYSISSNSTAPAPPASMHSEGRQCSTATVLDGAVPSEPKRCGATATTGQADGHLSRFDSSVPAPQGGEPCAASLPDPTSTAPVDYTQLPVLLEQQLAALDTDHAVRPTTIALGSPWRMASHHWARTTPTIRLLPAKEQTSLTAKAMDLLDALSCSGSLPLQDVQLHVLLAVTHCFDKTLLDVVVEDNINPIEGIERTGLIIASVVHAVPPAALICPAHAPRLLLQASHLFA